MESVGGARVPALSAAVGAVAAAVAVTIEDGAFMAVGGWFFGQADDAVVLRPRTAFGAGADVGQTALEKFAYGRRATGHAASETPCVERLKFLWGEHNLKP